MTKEMKRCVSAGQVTSRGRSKGRGRGRGRGSTSRSRGGSRRMQRSMCQNRYVILKSKCTYLLVIA